MTHVVNVRLLVETFVIALELLTGKGSDPQASSEVNITLVPLGRR